ncbi:acyl-CoA dehydrogenase family protein [Pseudorhodoferax sp.]|uniref:acyl-CoA dehydrogenase family protein n=1 Tax=Pseudorhodoferax sp. TaxID=1993553 RepID=UPI002DD622DD|nr:acyl-CoA dehydrogenase family protein [Pseudorhodoferax sp.]
MSAVRSAWIDDDLAMFQDAARRFIAAEVVPHELRWAAQTHVDRSIWNALGAAGLLCPAMPEEYGGGGGHFAHDAIVSMEMARALAIGPSLNVHSAIVAHYILRYGSEAQKRRWLPRMASGELVAAIAMSEPAAGSDLKAITTRAVRQGDRYIVNGAKTFITNGHLADLVCIVAKTDPAAGARGVSILVAETAGLPGFRRGRILDKIGLKGQDTSELFFDDMALPVENLLGGEEGRGFFQLMQQLPQERMLIALGTLATMERAVEDTLAYTRQRQVFGQPLFDLQNTRFKLAECRTKATVARAFVDDCMAKVLRGELSGDVAAMAKLWCTQTNCEIVDECLQLHGGYGYMTEYPIGRMYVNARVGKIYGGSNEIMKELVARGM